jgi:hypothetical protein
MVGNKKYPSTSYYLKKYKPFYWGLKKIYCKQLQADVLFGNIGWRHIRFDSHRHKRIPADIAMRFNLLPFVPEVLKQANAVVIEEGKLKNGNKLLFYELTQEVEVNGKKKNVTVIVTETLSGIKHYFSARYARKSKKNP